MEPSDISLQVELIQSIRGHCADVLGCSFINDRILATCSADKLIRLWSRDTTGKFAELPQSPLAAHSYAVNACHSSYTTTALVSASQDGRMICWDWKSGKKLWQVEHSSKGSLRVCRFSLNGLFLVTAGDDETLNLWDVSKHHLIRSLEGHEASVTSADFSPDSCFLASGSIAGDLRIWDVRFSNARFLACVEAHDLGVLACVFSPNQLKGADIGDTESSMFLLASGGHDNLVKVWTVQTDGVALYATLAGHSQNVMCLAFSRCGLWLVSGAGDKTVIIWHPVRREKMLCIDHHQRYVTCCSFSADGLLATGSNDKTVAIWRIFNPRNAADSRDQFASTVKTSEHCTCRAVVSASAWTVDDVCRWLSSIQMTSMVDTFSRNAIDGTELLHLTDGMLRESLGIEALGQRNKILRQLIRLRAPCNHPFDSRLVLSRSCKCTSEFPHEFFCPITHELMADPVVCADGYSYERSAISEWIESGRRSSPMTNAKLSHTDLIPNRALKLLIEKSVIA